MLKVVQNNDESNDNRATDLTTLQTAEAASSFPLQASTIPPNSMLPSRRSAMVGDQPVRRTNRSTTRSLSPHIWSTKSRD